MITVEEALDKILGLVTVLGTEKKPILDCLGQVLAEDIRAQFDVPSVDNSAMDGFALKASNIVGANHEKGKVLRVIGDIPAGIVPDLKVEVGTAARIMTGALIPEGADVVVPFEESDEKSRRNDPDARFEVIIYKELEAGENIRRSGEDIKRNELIMKSGKLLLPADIGVIASIGKSEVQTIRRPVIGILATGNELVELGQPLISGKLYNSNSYGLAAQVTRYGGIPKLLGIARDDIEQLTSILRNSLEDCDMLLTSGGVSVGDYDMVKDALASEGDISFWSVRMKPGKPVAFGTLRRTSGTRVPHLGLPGNPVSSMITFELFGRPAIYKMMGRTDWQRTIIKAVMADSVKNKDSRRIFARVIVSKRDGQYFAHLTGGQGSGILTSVIKANGLAIVPETVKEIKPGNCVDVIVLDWDWARSI